MRLRPQGAVRSSGEDAVALAAACGILLDGWQAEELYWALAELPTGSWAASLIGLICSRQNGKNVIVESRELYGAVVLGERILHTAHLFPTAKESYMALEEMVRTNPDVEAQLVDHHASPASGYDMVFRSGGRIQYIARSRTSGRGFRGIDLLVMDEAQDLNDEAQGALLPTISAKPNAQVWMQGSAPDLTSTVMHRLRLQGRGGNEAGVSFAEYSARPDADPDDREMWRQANPAHPHRVSEGTIADERRAMSEEMFLRERLSVSPDLLEAGGPFGVDWLSVCDPDATAKPGTFSLDVNPERSAAAIVGCGPGPVVSVVDYQAGTSWVVDRCAALRDKYKVSFAIDKTGPAASFIEELKRRRVRIIELDATDMVRAAGHLFDRVADQSVVVRTNDDLDRAVAGAVKRPVGDAFAWGRKHSNADICLLVAATAAVWAQDQKKRARMVNMFCETCGGVKGDCDHQPVEA